MPVENSFRASDKLKSAGVAVSLEVPDDAEHGFDARLGNVDIETVEGNSDGHKSLRNAIAFLVRAAI